MKPAIPVQVAILAMRESTFSAICGMYGLFTSAGDWPMIVDGKPVPQLL